MARTCAERGFAAGAQKHERRDIASACEMSNRIRVASVLHLITVTILTWSKVQIGDMWRVGLYWSGLESGIELVGSETHVEDVVIHYRPKPGFTFWWNILSFW